MRSQTDNSISFADETSSVPDPIPCAVVHREHSPAASLQLSLYHLLGFCFDDSCEWGSDVTKMRASLEYAYNITFYQCPRQQAPVRLSLFQLLEWEYDLTVPDTSVQWEPTQPYSDGVEVCWGTVL